MPGTECVAGELARCEREVWVEWVAPLSRSYRLLLSLRSVNGTITEKSNHFPCDLGRRDRTSLSLCLVL